MHSYVGRRSVCNKCVKVHLRGITFLIACAEGSLAADAAAVATANLLLRHSSCFFGFLWAAIV